MFTVKSKEIQMDRQFPPLPPPPQRPRGGWGGAVLMRLQRSAAPCMPLAYPSHIPCIHIPCLKTRGAETRRVSQPLHVPCSVRFPSPSSSPCSSSYSFRSHHFTTDSRISCAFASVCWSHYASLCSLHAAPLLLNAPSPSTARRFYAPTPTPSPPPHPPLQHLSLLTNPAVRISIRTAFSPSTPASSCRIEATLNHKLLFDEPCQAGVSLGLSLEDSDGWHSLEVAVVEPEYASVSARE